MVHELKIFMQWNLIKASSLERTHCFSRSDFMLDYQTFMSPLKPSELDWSSGIVDWTERLRWCVRDSQMGENEGKQKENREQEECGEGLWH